MHSNFSPIFLFSLILSLLTLVSAAKDKNLTQLHDESVNVASNETTRIVGGVEATRHEYPWLIRIQTKSGSLSCGGSILDKNLILTAAHCMTDDPKRDREIYEVLAGAHDMNSNENTRQLKRIQRINCHKNYDSENYKNDICILVLASDLTWTDAVKPIALADETTTLEGSATVAGWGFTQEGSNMVSPVLRKVTVPFVSNQICSQRYNPVEITSSMVCAGSFSKDSCQGDSGGALMYNFNSNSLVQVGVVSFGYGCGRTGFPGVYTRVSSYRKWISENSAHSIMSSSWIIPIFSILAFWILKY